MTELNTLVNRVLAGDLETFSEIIRRCQPDVWRVVAAMLLNNSQTEDLVQQTFVAIYRNLHQFQSGRDFPAWIKQIARNTVRQELRARGRELQRLEMYHRQLLTEWEAPAQESSVSEALEECTKLLPRDAAQIVYLRYEQGRDFGFIAQVLGRTVEAARQHLARIRLNLRACVEKRLAGS